MTDKIITNIAFLEDAVVIDYAEVSEHPVQRSNSLYIPHEYAQNDDQLWQDFKELLDDAKVLLDSAQIAYHATDRRTKEMGRS